MLIVADSVLPPAVLARLLQSSDLDVVEAAATAAETVPHVAGRYRWQGDAVNRMSPREREVLAQMAEGRSNAGIAAALVISDSAVAKHINSIFTKLNIPPAANDNRRVLAVLSYLCVKRRCDENPLQCLGAADAVEFVG